MKYNYTVLGLQNVSPIMKIVISLQIKHFVDKVNTDVFQISEPCKKLTHLLLHQHMDT